MHTYWAGWLGTWFRSSILLTTVACCTITLRSTAPPACTTSLVTFTVYSASHETLDLCHHGTLYLWLWCWSCVFTSTTVAHGWTTMLTLSAVVVHITHHVSTSEALGLWNCWTARMGRRVILGCYTGDTHNKADSDADFSGHFGILLLSKDQLVSTADLVIL